MNTLYPVILTVPSGKQETRSRERTAFLSRHARLAATLSAEKIGVVLNELQNDSDGCPIPEKGWFWSISHKPTRVAGVTATFPTGIDIEQVRPVRPELYLRITDPVERSLFNEDDPLSFFRVWTAKEAVIKAAGGRYNDIFNCRVSRVLGNELIEITFKNKRWSIVHVYFDCHIAAMVSNGSNVCWCFE